MQFLHMKGCSKRTMIKKETISLLRNRFARNLQYLRKARRLSQQVLADHLGLTRSKITSYETGKAEPNIDKLVMLSRFFETSLDELLNAELQADQNRSGAISGLQAGKDPHTANPNTEVIARLKTNAAQHRKIAEGLQALHAFKVGNLPGSSPEMESVIRDQDNLLMLINSLLELNAQLLNLLEDRQHGA